MISIKDCATLTGLALDEMALGVTPAKKHRDLHSSYSLNLHRGRLAVRNLIIADMRRSRELGAMRRAADLLLVLRLFLSEHWDIAPVPGLDAGGFGEKDNWTGRPTVSRRRSRLPPVKSPSRRSLQLSHSAGRRNTPIGSQ